MKRYKTSLPDHRLFSEEDREFWVFAYGSLMWRPDFPFVERQPATLEGFARALCIYSWVHRGTREKPGLVFGLDEGGSCDGFAYQIAHEHRMPVVEALRARELVTNVYQEMTAPVHLTGGEPRRVEALIYTAVHNHEQYAGTLPVHETVEIVRQGKGGSGNNIDYVLNTHHHLIDEGIDDPRLVEICRQLLATS